MDSYMNSSLWSRSLGINEEQCLSLRKSYIDTRENAKTILEKIRIDFPSLTIHDISHVDSLWSVASVIIGPKYPINPLEAYILGIAFLIHDFALSYDAFGGVSSLRSTNEWKDAFAEQGYNDSEEIKKECDFFAIRTLHAKRAETVLNDCFIREDGSSFYLISDESLRKHLSLIIGRIAASHHWGIDELYSLSNQMNPLAGMPNEWTVNPIKLACILRCADAGHIDAGRAPDSIYRLLKLNKVSQSHWNSQNHLCQVCEDSNDSKMLLITSSNSFNKADYASWNVAYELITLFDKEIKASNRVLSTMGCAFPHVGVTGVSTKEELSNYIKTNGWIPCDATVHIENAKQIIEKLGGEQLYGKDDKVLVVLRELAQNARDAIIARSLYEKTNKGNIHIIIEKDANDSFWITVEDSGIGMSFQCIKDKFLGFGESYWSSDLAKVEFPGLASSGFSSAGKFGIGFYSIFMVSDYVVVETRRYDRGLDKNIKLEFIDGLSLSPIVSFEPSSRTDKSTSIKFKLKNGLLSQNLLYEVKRNIMNSKNIMVPFKKIISTVVVGLDVDVFYKQDGHDFGCIHRDIYSNDFNVKEWFEDFSYQSEQNINVSSDHFEKVYMNNRIIGYGTLNFELSSTQNFLSIRTVNGLAQSIHSRDGQFFKGFIDSDCFTVSRNNAKETESLKQVVHEWAKQQYEKYYKERIVSPKYGLLCQDTLCFFGIDPSDISAVYRRSDRQIVWTKDIIDDLLNGVQYLFPKMKGINHFDLHVDLSNVELEHNEEMIIPLSNSSFLDLDLPIKPNDYSLIGCINKNALDRGLKITIHTIENRFRSLFLGFADAICLSIE